MEEPDDPPLDGDAYDDDSAELEEYEVGGEAGGEQQTSTDEPFFVSKQAAAVFKHRLIQVYFPKFVGKAGSTEADRRLAFIDTHAGRGQYDDGTAGSPLLIARTVAGMAQRRIDCFFIEKKPSNYRKLRQVLGESMPSDANWVAECGSASEYLAEGLAFAGDSPLFMFIDPYGLGPSFAEVVQVLNRPRRGFGRKTEVLLNFISGAFGRAGAYLRLDDPTPQQVKTLAHLDEVLNGGWWRDLYLSTEVAHEAVEQIAQGYAYQVHRATEASWTLIPVRNRSHHVPLYWLLHFTHHPDGLWWIREAAAQASYEWRRYCSPPPPEDGVLFQVDDPFVAEEEARQARWISEIEANARRAFARDGRIDVRAQARELFGDTFGLAWAKHLRRALSRLYDDGLLLEKPFAANIDKYASGRRDS